MTDEAALYPVRADLAAAHARAWDRLARAGTWLDGPTRIRVGPSRPGTRRAVRAAQGSAVALRGRGHA